MGRRRVIALAGVAAALTLSGGGVTGWRFGTSGRDSGTVRAQAPGSLVGERKGPAPVWTFRPEQPYQFAELVIGEKNVYLAGPVLEAIDPSTGRRRWSAEIAPTGMLLSGSQIYAGSPDYRLNVLDAVTGRRQRQIQSDELHAVFQETAKIIGSSGDLLVLAARGAFVAVFDTRTRRLVWRRNLAVDPRQITVGEGACYVRDEQALYALALDDGRESWRVQLTAATGLPNLVMSARSLYTSTADGAVAFDLAGRRLWTSRLQDRDDIALHADATVGEGTAFYFLVDDVFALDSATGERRWHARAPAPASSIKGQGPAASSAVVAVAFDEQRTSTGFGVMDARTGASRWSVQTPGDRSTLWTLDVDAGSVFAFDGVHLYAFRG
jgi:outer membrane protein assembly factor BamB